MNKRVTGIGGVFFKSKAPKKLSAWYHDHLGIPVEEWGGWIFPWREAGRPAGKGYTVWNPFPADTDYFSPSRKPFMINLRVDDLDAVLAALKKEGVRILPRVEESAFGRFGWILDPEGTKIELWEPPGAKKKPRKK